MNDWLGTIPSSYILAAIGVLLAGFPILLMIETIRAPLVEDEPFDPDHHRLRSTGAAADPSHAGAMPDA